ncbi:MAG: hypothetical protein AAGE94_04240 [Acidobacteriota bacterium]
MKKPLLLTLAFALACAATLGALTLAPTPATDAAPLCLVPTSTPTGLPGTVVTDFAVSCEFLCARYYDGCINRGGSPAECQAGEELCLAACP